jgi:flavin-dependent dehydrogenase
MPNYDYDVITVGGGLGGAALAKVLATKGLRVLVAERERQFKDRIRGEVMWPWGVAEARTLGLYDRILETCAHELPFIDLARLY